MFSPSSVKRFWDKVNSTGPCWIWTAFKNPHGYGQVRIDNRAYLSHRVSWIIHNRAHIPDGLYVLHACDNPACVNPKHLFLGTQRENISDMMAKARHRSTKGGSYMPTGTSHHLYSKGHKITREQAYAIRSDTRKQSDIARAFGVDQALVSKIKNNHIWKE